MADPTIPTNNDNAMANKDAKSFKGCPERAAVACPFDELEINVLDRTVSNVPLK